MENNTNKFDKKSGYLFVGFMFIGIAIGQFLQEPGAGLMGGMGVGFIVSAFYPFKK